MTSARILHIFDKEPSRQERKPHRITDDERKRKEQKDADANGPENHAELPGRNFFDPLDRCLHLFKAVFARKRILQLDKCSRILAVVIQRHSEKRGNRVPFYKVEHLSRKVPAKIGQGRIGAHERDRPDMLGMFQAGANDLQGIFTHGLGQERLDRIEVLFHRKHAHHAPERHERRRKQ